MRPIRSIDVANNLFTEITNDMQERSQTKYTENCPYFTANLKKIPPEVLEKTQRLFRVNGYVCELENDGQSSCFGNSTTEKRFRIYTDLSPNISRAIALEAAADKWEGYSAEDYADALYAYLKNECQEVEETGKWTYQSPCLHAFKRQTKLLQKVANRFFTDFSIRPGTEVFKRWSNDPMNNSYHCDEHNESHRYPKTSIIIHLDHKFISPPRNESYNLSDLSQTPSVAMSVQSSAPSTWVKSL